MSVITVNQLVLDAYLLTGEFDPINPPSQGQVSRGIAELKYIIECTPSISLPFQKSFTFNLEAGKRIYTFGETPAQDFDMRRIQRLNTAFITWNDVTYDVKVLDQVVYYQSLRVNTLQTLPKICVLENSQGYSQITIYPKPDIEYQFTIKYMEDLGDFTPQQPIDNIPPYQFKFIRYELASVLCDIYNLSWSPKKSEELERLRKIARSQNFHDLVVRASTGRDAGYGRILSGV